MIFNVIKTGLLITLGVALYVSPCIGGRVFVFDPRTVKDIKWETLQFAPFEQGSPIQQLVSKIDEVSQNAGKRIIAFRDSDVDTIIKRTGEPELYRVRTTSGMVCGAGEYLNMVRAGNTWGRIESIVYSLKSWGKIAQADSNGIVCWESYHGCEYVPTHSGKSWDFWYPIALAGCFVFNGETPGFLPNDKYGIASPEAERVFLEMIAAFKPILDTGQMGD